MFEMNAFVDQYSSHSPVANHEQQQHQKQETEDVDLDELMFEMNEFVDQYASVASPLSPASCLSYIISLCFNCSKS